jgi:hypothetical protein
MALLIPLSLELIGDVGGYVEPHPGCRPWQAAVTAFQHNRAQ